MTWIKYINKRELTREKDSRAKGGQPSRKPAQNITHSFGAWGGRRCYVVWYNSFEFDVAQTMEMLLWSDMSMCILKLKYFLKQGMQFITIL